MNIEKEKGYSELSFRMFTFSLILFLPWPWYRASLLQNIGTEGWNVHMFTSTNFHFHVDVDIPQVTSALGRSGRLCMRCWQHAQMGGPLPPYGHPWLWSWWWDDVGENAKWCAGCWWLWTTTRCGWLLTYIWTSLIMMVRRRLQAYCSLASDVWWWEGYKVSDLLFSSQCHISSSMICWLVLLLSLTWAKGASRRSSDCFLTLRCPA